MYITRSIETTAAAQPPPSSSLPIGAIAGGIVAGALLAVVVALGCLLWGAKRRRRTQPVRWGQVVSPPHEMVMHPLYVNRQEAEPKQHVGDRAGLSEPRSPSEEPLFPPDRKIKFELRPSDMESGSSSTLVGLPEVSKPRPLRSVKTSSRSLLGPRDRYLAMGRPSSPKITHKPSTVSSVSMYSTASGEEHQVRVPPNLILAATGGPEVDPVSDRRSGISSNWSFLSRMSHGVQENSVRHSQTSSQSAYTALSKDSSGAPIGVAL